MTAIGRRDFLKQTAGAAAARTVTNRLGAEAAPAVERPNIIFILCDDYGIAGASCYGSDKFKTPNLDALAQGGIRFEYGYACPLCAPTRAACMTGRYGFRTGVIDNGTGGRLRPENETTVAKCLKQAGYATAVAGKWRQLQYFNTPQDARAWGFDEFMVWGVGAKAERYWNPEYNHNGKIMEDVKDKFGPDLLHEFVVDFIRRHKDGPFFVYYPMVSVHGPLARTPDGKDDAKAILLRDNIAYMDKLVGKLVEELERLGLREKTLVVFVGDNGLVSGGTINGRRIDGAKGAMTEGGSRVPYIASWKGTTKPGQVVSDLVDVTDLFPTFAEVARAPLPQGVAIDGHSFAWRLRNRPGEPREWVYVQLGDERYVRNARYKLYANGDLFDMKEAPFREIPVEPGAPEVEDARKHLRAVLDKLLAQDQRKGPASPKSIKPKKAKKAVTALS